MPRPGQVRSPEYERGASLPYGAATRANAQRPFLGLGAGDEEDWTPSTPEEVFLFSPTDRPNEPVTAGAPFGPGPNFVSRPVEDERAFLGRIGQAVAATPLADNPEVKGFLDKLARGL